VEDNAYITSLFAGIVYLGVALRLLRLSLRTGQRPERLLGIYFMGSSSYYLGYTMPSLMGFDDWPDAAIWTIEWIYILGAIPYLFFIREVFRPLEGWARGLVWICSILMSTGTALGSLGGYSDFNGWNPWFLMQWVGYTLPPAWIAFEAERYRRSASKRIAIGLCEPIVANRYLLIMLFGGFQVRASLTFLIFPAEFAYAQSVSVISDALVGGTEIASAALLWLAFCPPSFYTNWITRHSAAQPARQEG